MIVAATLFAISIAIASYVLQPLFSAHGVAGEPTPDAAPPVQDAIADSLRDLELDWSMGKLSDEDYQRQRAQLITEAEARGQGQ